MISKVKKNKIDLFDLKNEKDLYEVEKSFDRFLKKLFKNRSQHFYEKKNCTCGDTKRIKKVKMGLFNYIECICGTYFINPMIKTQTLNLIYSEKGPYSMYRKKFIENKKKKNLRINVINNRKVLQVCSFLKDKKKSILDIGCGDGGFLKVCQKYGFMNIQGIDTKYKATITRNKISFYNSIEDLGNDKKFDLITLWGVLEHLNDPNKFTKKILKLLNKKGFILLETPNSESTLMKHLISVKEKAYRFLEPGRHLYFFSKKFYDLFAKKNKMSLIDYETNGLDLQTIIGPTNRNLTKKILDFQKTLDDDKSSDHLRVLLQKN